MAANFKVTPSFQTRGFVLSVCIAAFCIEKAFSSHVIGMANLNYFSHNRVLWKIGTELQAKGHKYTQVLPSYAKDSYPDVEVKVFNTSVTEEIIEEAHATFMKLDNLNSISGAFRFFQAVQSLNDMVQSFCNDLFDSDHLISEIRESVDLVLCDTTNPCCPVLAGALNITRVDVSPVGFLGVFSAVYYNTPIAYLPLEHMPDSPQAFSFVNRLKSFITFMIMRSTISKMLPHEIWEKHAPQGIEYAMKPSGIALIPHDFALNYPRPLAPNVKVIGPVLAEPAQKLPNDLETFLTNKEVVVVSFGTTLSSHLPGFVEKIAEALGKLPYHVLWKQVGNLPEDMGSNIKIISWFPQNDVLGHPSTKVFVTHGGLNSVLESVYHAVPMVVLPFFGDQHEQASLVTRKELGISLDKKVVKSEDIARSIIEVANNKKYKENVQHISELLRDRPQSPAKEGAYWVDYALKHRGVKHLMSNAYNMPLYQLYMFDVFLFICVAILVVICMFVGLCYFVVCRRKSRKEKTT